MLNLAMNPFKLAPKPPGAAFAKMVSELETEHFRSQVTREIIQAKLTASSHGTGDHEPKTRALIGRLFPM